MDKILVVGTSGLAREFSAFFGSQADIIGYISDNAEEHKRFNLTGKHYPEDVTPEETGTDLCVIAIANPEVKEKFRHKLGKVGFKFPSFVHPTSVVASDITAEGVVVGPNCTVGVNVDFGAHVFVNFMVGIGHDCTLGDFTQVNPGAQIGGGTEVGSHVLIGSNATVRQGLSVAQSATVSSGAVVLNRVRQGVTVIGNPARKLKLPF